MGFNVEKLTTISRKLQFFNTYDHYPYLEWISNKLFSSWRNPSWVVEGLWKYLKNSTYYREVTSYATKFFLYYFRAWRGILQITLPPQPFHSFSEIHDHQPNTLAHKNRNNTYSSSLVQTRSSCICTNTFTTQQTYQYSIWCTHKKFHFPRSLLRKASPFFSYNWFAPLPTKRLLQYFKTYKLRN